MKLSIEGIKCVLEESKKQMLSWKSIASMESKHGKINSTLDAVLNGKVRWWYNPVTAELQPMANERLNDYPTVEPNSYFHGSTINNSWILVFNTSNGYLVQ